MKIGLQTWGTSGDIWPFLELSAGLSKAGHDVTCVITSMNKANYTQYSEKYKIKIIEASDDECYKYGNVLSEINDEDQRNEFFSRIEACALKATEGLCADNDIVIGNQGAYYLHTFAELKNKPYVTVSTNHSLVPSKRKPFWLNGQDDLGEEINNSSWNEVEKSINEDFSAYVNNYRAKYGLRPVNNLFKEVTHSSILHLISTSKVFCTQQDEWEGHRYVSGYFFPQPDSSIPTGLKEFIDAGDPPLMITFGSSWYFLNNVKGIVTDAIKIAGMEGKRIIVQALVDTFDTQELDEHVYLLSEFIDYRSVLPHCALLIHHGGAGTTHFSVLCEIPSIILPDNFDMPFWGAVLHAKGIAPSPIPIREVNFDNLYDRIKEVLLNQQYKNEAKKLSEIMKMETPVEIAVNAIEHKFSALIAAKEVERSL